MAHYTKPFFRPARNLWYVQIDGRQHNLGSEKTVAFNSYHTLMQHRSDVETSVQPQATPAAQQLVVVIILFLLQYEGIAGEFNCKDAGYGRDSAKSCGYQGRYCANEFRCCGDHAATIPTASGALLSNSADKTTQNLYRSGQ